MSSNKLKNTLLKSHRATHSNDSAFPEQVGGDWYKKLKIQPLDYAMDNNLNACQTKVVKYISRYNLKHKTIKDQNIKAYKKVYKRCIRIINTPTSRF